MNNFLPLIDAALKHQHGPSQTNLHALIRAAEAVSADDLKHLRDVLGQAAHLAAFYRPALAREIEQLTTMEETH